MDEPATGLHMSDIVHVLRNIGHASHLIRAIQGRDLPRAPGILVGGQAFQSRPRAWQQVGAGGGPDKAFTYFSGNNSLTVELQMLFQF
jgi:hypothetical protein